MNKYLVLPNKKELNIFKVKNFNSFILPLKNYSIGFDVYFDINEINEFSKENSVYIMINKFFHKKDLINFENEINNLNMSNIKGVFVEDLGIIKYFDKDKVIIYQNHIINNHENINYFSELGYKSVVLNNDLTIGEINNIRSKTNSKLFYFIISKNILMYSKRKLLSNYFINYELNKKNNKYVIKEDVSKTKLIVKEEGNSTTISDNNIFIGNKYINDLKKLDVLIINFSNLNKEETMTILDNYDKEELHKMIECDYYFLENEIKYKVGDLE